MTIHELTKLDFLTPITIPSPESSIDGVYAGDLLSWVMAKAKTGNLWLTIMSNVNIVAVAALTEISAIILAEDVQCDTEVLTVANEKGINILSSPLSVYQLSVKLSNLSV